MFTFLYTLSALAHLAVFAPVVHKENTDKMAKKNTTVYFNRLRSDKLPCYL